MAERLILEEFPLAVYLPALKDSNVRRYRIYIMPTRNGLFFILMLFAMLLGAVNYNNSMAYIMTFLLFSLLPVTMLHSYRNLAGLTMYENPVSAVFAGDTAIFSLIIDNQRGHQRYALHMLKAATTKWYLQPLSNDSPVSSCYVNAGQRKYIKLALLASQRGIFMVGSVKIYTIFPLGLFKAWASIEMHNSCLVYPKPLGNKSLPPRKVVPGSSSQGNAVGTDDFVGFRNYHIGDSIKDIVWKIYAQEKGLLVKKFTGTGSEKLEFSWGDTAYIKDVDARLSQLCLWIIEAESHSLHYRLDMPDAHVDSAHGTKHMHHCLSLLAKYRHPKS